MSKSGPVKVEGSTIGITPKDMLVGDCYGVDYKGERYSFRRNADGTIVMYDVYRETTKGETPIYEKLADGECMILEKSSGSVLIVTNKGGECVITRMKIPLRCEGE